MPDPNRDAPREVREALTRFGGVNMYDRPLWRACLAENRLAKRGGIFHEFPDGKMEQFAFHRGADGLMRQVHIPLKPKSVKHGYMEVPKYPVTGWIVERWFPPSKYGPRDVWESQKGQDGVTPLLGPYPHEGDYFMLLGPWDKLPAISDLQCAIAQHLHAERNRPASYETMVANLVREAKDQEEREYQKYIANLEQFRKSEILPVLRSTSLSAQRVRQQVQQSLGLKSHAAID